MLSTYEVVLYAAVLPLVPLAIWSLMTGSVVPENSSFSKYYRAEKHLALVGNLFLLAVCANAVARLVQHYGIVSAEAGQSLIFWIGLPFVALLFLSSVMWINAIIKVRRDLKITKRQEAGL